MLINKKKEKSIKKSKKIKNNLKKRLKNKFIITIQSENGCYLAMTRSL